MRDRLSNFGDQARINALHEEVMFRIANESSEIAELLASTGFNPAYYFSSLGRYYLYLHHLVRLTEPSLIVELGTLFGVSALAMYSALPPQCRLVTIDIVHSPKPHLESISDSRLTIVCGNSLDSALLDRLRLFDIDLLFVDTDHVYEQATAESELYFPRMKRGGIVAYDDIHLNPGMDQFWRELQSPKVDCGPSIHHTGFGIAVVG